MRNRMREKGMGMVEVLVALFISSIAITGLAGLQVTAIKATNDASQSSVAVWVVQDLIERIKNNPSAAKMGDYQFVFSAVDSCKIKPQKICAPHYSGTELEGDSCDAKELAQFDVWDVMCGSSSENGVISHAAGSLVQPKIIMACSPDGCSQYSINLEWHQQDSKTIDNSVSLAVVI